MMLLLERTMCTSSLRRYTTKCVQPRHAFIHCHVLYMFSNMFVRINFQTTSLDLLR